MKWYYKVMGGHTHVRVFMGGGKCGDLVFRNEEFNYIRLRLTDHLHPVTQFIDETEYPA